MIDRVIRDITRYFEIYAGDACVVGIFIMLLYGCICFFMALKKAAVLENLKEYVRRMLPRYVSVFLMGFYLYIMLNIALLSRREKYIDKIDLSLLGMGLSTQMNRVFTLENVIMFVPFGLLLPVCFPKLKHPALIALFGFLGSLCIEVTQYVAKWGRFEFVDLWTNTLGAAIGWMIGRVFFLSYQRLKSILKK